MRIGPKSNIQDRLFRTILSTEMIVDDFVVVLTRVLRLRTIVVLVGLCAWLPLAGCQILGPAALGTGRGAYNDVIARTSSEQTLGLIVRLRYSDPINLLAVSSVTAGLKFSTQAKGEAGFGSPASYAGALVPFSAGITYEDSPLISYTPVDAQAFLREWLAPVTLETLALAMQGGPGQDALMVLLILVERMNGLRSGVGATVEERTAFHRVATLLTQFRELGVALWVQESGATGRYELILSHYSPGRIAEVEEFLRLLELQGNPAQESTIRIPVALGVRDGNFTAWPCRLARSRRSYTAWRRRSRCLASMSRRASWRPARSLRKLRGPWARSCASIRAEARRGRPTSPCSIVAGGTMWTTRTWQVNGRSCRSRCSSLPVSQRRLEGRRAHRS